MNAVKADERHSEVLIPVWWETIMERPRLAWSRPPARANGSGQRARWRQAKTLRSHSNGPVGGQRPRRFAAVLPDRRLIEISVKDR